MNGFDEKVHPTIFDGPTKMFLNMGPKMGFIVREIWRRILTVLALEQETAMFVGCRNMPAQITRIEG